MPDKQALVLDYPVAAPEGIAPVIYRAMIIQTMALEYIKYMAGTDDPLTEDEAFDAAHAAWDTEWPDDPAPRTIEAGIEVANDDLSYWYED